MKISNITKILLQLKRLFISYLNENDGLLMSYHLIDNMKALNVDFAINMSTFMKNQEIIMNFIKKYNLESYIHITQCQHIMQNNYMRSIFTFEIVKMNSKQQKELCGLLIIK